MRLDSVAESAALAEAVSLIEQSVHRRRVAHSSLGWILSPSEQQAYIAVDKILDEATPIPDHFRDNLCCVQSGSEGAAEMILLQIEVRSECIHEPSLQGFRSTNSHAANSKPARALVCKHCNGLRCQPLLPSTDTVCR